MNVALTRAKSSVFILGNAATLERSDENWKTIVQDARERSALVDVSVFLVTTSSVGTERNYTSVQTDVSFFTAPGRGTIAPPKSTKPKKSAPKPQASAAPPAEDLIALGRTSPVKPPSQVAATDIVSNAMDTLPTVMTPSTASVAGQKRPAEDALMPPSAPAIRAQERTDVVRPPRPPKPPVARKPKAPRSIFINRNPPRVSAFCVSAVQRG